jgi:hypothetical protein
VVVALDEPDVATRPTVMPVTATTAIAVVATMFRLREKNPGFPAGPGDGAAGKPGSPVGGIPVPGTARGSLFGSNWLIVQSSLCVTYIVRMPTNSPLPM